MQPYKTPDYRPMWMKAMDCEIRDQDGRVAFTGKATPFTPEGKPAIPVILGESITRELYTVKYTAPWVSN